MLTFMLIKDGHSLNDVLMVAMYIYPSEQFRWIPYDESPVTLEAHLNMS